MNALWLLLGLLALSYLGSILISGRAIRGFGLPSGAEYLVLGFVLGPSVLSVLGRTLLDLFRPAVVVGVGWLALVIGIGYLRVGVRKVRLSRIVLGAALALLTHAVVSVAVWFAARHFTKFGSTDLLLLAVGCGTVTCETTRHSVRWVAERHGAHGKLADLAADLARASAIIPAISIAALFALSPGEALPFMSLPARVGINLGLGIVLGLMAVFLLGSEFRRDESWGLLLGASLLGMGATARMGLSPLSTMFAMGLTLTIVSRHRFEIKAMVTPTEKPVLLPVVMLAGAYVDLSLATYLFALGAVAVGVKLIMRLLCGTLAGAFVPAARGYGGLLGVSMMSSGALSIGAALAFVVRYPGRVSDLVLLLAAVTVVLGEVVGPAALRRALDERGEIDPDAKGRVSGDFTDEPPSVRSRV